MNHRSHQSAGQVSASGLRSILMLRAELARLGERFVAAAKLTHGIAALRPRPDEALRHARLEAFEDRQRDVVHIRALGCPDEHGLGAAERSRLHDAPVRLEAQARRRMERGLLRRCPGEQSWRRQESEPGALRLLNRLRLGQGSVAGAATASVTPAVW